MSLEHALLFLHIAGAFLMVAGIVAETALALRGAKTARAHTLSVLTDLQLRLGRLVFIPGAVLAIVFGTWLVPEADYSFSGAWLSAAYLLWIVALGIGTGVIVPQARRTHAHAERLIAQGVAESEELRAEFAASRPAVMRWAMNLMVVLFLYLMVFRPGA